MSKKYKNKPNGLTLMASDLPPAVRVFWETTYRTVIVNPYKTIVVDALNAEKKEEA